ncbi:hypothetical protein Dimus_039602 [Dionaea muscipula]
MELAVHSSSSLLAGDSHHARCQLARSSLTVITLSSTCSVPAWITLIVLAGHHHHARCHGARGARARAWSSQCSPPFSMAAARWPDLHHLARGRGGARYSRARCGSSCSPCSRARMHHLRSSAACVTPGARLHDASSLLAGEGPCSPARRLHPRCSPARRLAARRGGAVLACSPSSPSVLACSPAPHRHAAAARESSLPSSCSRLPHMVLARFPPPGCARRLPRRLGSSLDASALRMREVHTSRKPAIYI